MKIRPFNPSDLGRIEEIAKRYDFPLDRSKVITEAVVTKDDKVTGYGIVRPIAESIMVIEGDKRDIVRGLDLLHRQAVIDAALARFDQIHAFVEPEFARILKRHYGYRNAKGEVLVREV